MFTLLYNFVFYVTNITVFFLRKSIALSIIYHWFIFKVCQKINLWKSVSFLSLITAFLQPLIFSADCTCTIIILELALYFNPVLFFRRVFISWIPCLPISSFTPWKLQNSKLVFDRGGVQKGISVLSLWVLVYLKRAFSTNILIAWQGMKFYLKLFSFTILKLGLLD